MTAVAPAAVITGLGTVSASGCGNEALAQDLAQGTARFSEIDRSEGFHRLSRDTGSRDTGSHDNGSRGRGSKARTHPSAVLGGLVNGADFSAWLKPAQSRRMSPLSRNAVVAARIAVEAAKIAVARNGSQHATPRASAAKASEDRATDYEASSADGVFLGCAYGPTSYTERILRQIFVEGPTSVSPSLFTESVANAPAAQIALQLGMRGPNVTVTQREAGSLIALGMAAREVRSRRLRRALCGSVDELNPLLHAALDSYGALSRSRGRRPEQARPFDRRRNGFVAAEGSTVVVVEAEPEGAAGQGRPALARVVLSVSAFDPDAPRTDWSHSPDRLAWALGQALTGARLDPSDIDLVVSAANGSISGDRLEALVLKRVWGDRALPPILAPKAVTGEQGGSTLATAILALQGRPFGPTPGFESVDPELGITPHPGGDLPLPRRVLITGLAVGGAAAWAVLERCTP